MRTPPSTAPAEPDSVTPDQLGRAAVTVLIQNWRGHATVPSRSLYPHQWSWDSAFIALGLQHWAPRRAASELLSMFGAQWADGRVPHIAFNPAVPEDAYFPGPAFWRSHDVPDHPPVETSGIIQPPVHAIAAAEVIERLGEPGEGFAQRIYPLLVAQNSYIRRCRAVTPASTRISLPHCDAMPACDTDRRPARRSNGRRSRSSTCPAARCERSSIAAGRRPRGRPKRSASPAWPSCPQQEQITNPRHHPGRTSFNDHHHHPSRAERNADECHEYLDDVIAKPDHRTRHSRTASAEPARLLAA